MNVVELGDESFGALYVSGGLPFIFFNTVTFPAYQAFNISAEYLTVEDLFNFILFDTVTDNWRHIPFGLYNTDRSPNEIGKITEAIDLVVQYKGHRSRSK